MNDYLTIKLNLFKKYRYINNDTDNLMNKSIDLNQIKCELNLKNIQLIQKVDDISPNGKLLIGKHLPTERLIAIKLINKYVMELKFSSTIIKRNLPYDRLCYNNDDNQEYLCKIYEMFITSNNQQQFVIIHDYHQNGNLYNFINNNNNNNNNDIDMGKILLKILKALNHMHLIGIAHRNLKLENILINNQYEPILTDYTYTIIINNCNLNDSILSTSLPYLAPEIIIEQIPYDPIKADVWSFGICTYICYTNTIPFNPWVKLNDTIQLNDNLSFIQYKNHQKQFDNDIKQILNQTLQYDCNKRISTTDLLLNQYSLWYHCTDEL